LVGYGSTLTVLALSSEARALPAALLDDVRDRVHRRGVTAAYLRRLGDPLEGLLETARQVDAQLIVVGRDETPTRDVPRSVGEALVRLASCDVLVVR
ncbi:MAG: universal stress protein, partial [Gaiellaceae bacterium]|nr:universal stress protein [Gaiellaceae bacterium]